MTLDEKYGRLCTYFSGIESVAVAFSGGVDSAFLLKVAHDVLGERAIAVTAFSSAFPKRESTEAKELCQREGIRQVLFAFDAMSVKEFAENPPDRCYYCKQAIFQKIKSVAAENGVSHIAEGSNEDDKGDYRPGYRAIRELGIESPLQAAGLTKEEIRTLSKRLGLPTWEKPSLACLASRIPYGERITKEKLSQVEQAEEILRAMGFRQMRVRHHDNLARIELLPEDFERMLERNVREVIDGEFKTIGFSYVSLDLLGYRTGSMNEILKKD